MRRCSASRTRCAPVPSGRRGRTGWPCASSTTTTPSSPRSTRTRATTFRRSSPSPSTSASTARPWCAPIATGYEIQMDLVRAISLHKHKIDHVRAPRSVGGRRHRHPARTRRRHHRPGRRAGAAHDHGHPSVPQGRDLHVEGARPRLRRQDGGRSRRPCDARGRPLRRRSTKAKTGVIAWMLDGKDAAYGRSASRARRAQARDPRLVHEGALRRSIRRRRGSTWPESSTAATPSSPTRRRWRASCCTRATTPTT